VSPILTVETLLWAQEFVLKLIVRQATMFKENIESNGFDQARNKVLRSIRRGNRTRRDIAKNCNVYRKDFDDSIRVLIESGLVVQTPEGFAPSTLDRVVESAKESMPKPVRSR
jgi:predicted transcriptional regulator